MSNDMQLNLYFFLDFLMCNLILKGYISNSIMHDSRRLNSLYIKTNIRTKIKHSSHNYSMWVLFPSFSKLVKNKRGIFSTSVTLFLVPSGD